MIKTFEQNGLRFSYPQNWRLERDEMENGWTVVVQSPNTSFLLVSLDKDMPSPELMVDSTLEAMKSDYKDLESEERLQSIAGQPALGADIQFTSLDLTNTCCVRSFFSEEGTVLVMWQGADIDLEDQEPVFQAILASMEIF